MFHYSLDKNINMSRELCAFYVRFIFSDMMCYFILPNEEVGRKKKINLIVSHFLYTLLQILSLYHVSSQI